MSKKDDPYGNVEFLRDWMVQALKPLIDKEPGKITPHRGIAIMIMRLAEAEKELLSNGEIGEIQGLLGRALLDLIFTIGLTHADFPTLIGNAAQEVLEEMKEFQNEVDTG